MIISWRFCFSKDHPQPVLRDLEHELGVAGLDPSSTPLGAVAQLDSGNVLCKFGLREMSDSLASPHCLLPWKTWWATHFQAHRRSGSF